MEKYKNIKL